MSELALALLTWRAVVGPDHVVTDASTLAQAETATFFTSPRIPAIIKPGTLNEVVQCVKIANEFDVPIHPISAGKNWGYGSRVPTYDQCAVLDLGRLNHILEFNEEMAYVTVEPGVTFQQLYNHLQQTNSNLFLSVPGTTPEASIIGNTLERGIGLGPYAARFEHVCALEVVLPTGEVIHTGFERFQRSKAARTFKWGVGPYLDGIFTQSNLGIVTKMTIWLTPHAKYFQTFLFQLSDEQKLGGLIDTLRTLTLQGILRANVQLVNDYRVLAQSSQYPWRDAAGAIPLPNPTLEKIKGDFKCATWNGSGALYSISSKQARAERQLIRRLVRGHVDRLVFLSDKLAKLPPPAQWVFEFRTGLDFKETFKRSFGQSRYKGIPTLANLRAAYWRKQVPVPQDMDLDRDRCGIFWIDPIAPFRGPDVLEALDIIRRCVHEYTFEPNIGIDCLSERAVYITVALIYDREVPDEDKRAYECHCELLRRLTDQGFIPGRLTVLSQVLLPTPKDDYSRVLYRLKSALDPNDILSPGRYDARHEWQDDL